MLHAIFEEADLEGKVSTSLASGDWSNWSAIELDRIVWEGERADRLIGQIVQRDKEFPDNLWEAMSRKYSAEELSGSLAHYLVDEDNGKVHLHQSYIDRLTAQDKQRLIRSVAPLTRDVEPKRWVGSRDAGTLKHVPWDTSEIEKAKRFVEQIQAAKRSAAAQKGLQTKKEKKENETKEGGEGLKPTMTEHWHRWMPDDVPTGDVSWERLRGLLKTKSKLDIDLMLREMEKAGVVTASEHGSKVFRGEKYREIMSEKKERFAHSHIKDFEGTSLAKMQMIRGSQARPALVSVGLPLSVDNRWKKEHPKLHAFLKKIRKSNHGPVYKGIRPFGWVRIDKLDHENWLIEEIQQDIDNIESEYVGQREYGAETNQARHDKTNKKVETHKKELEHLDECLAAAKLWLEEVKQHEAAWKTEWGNATAFHIDGKRSGDVPKQDALLQDVQAKAFTAGMSGYLKPEQWFTTEYVNYLIEITKDRISQVEGYTNSAEGDLHVHKAAIDNKLPENKMTQEWQADIAAVKDIVGKFPRWAMHAIKLAAKERGVKNLWWVTYSQKKKLGKANPPRSFTSDQLARKFGFKKVALEKDPTYSSPCYPLVGTGIIEPILREPEQSHWERVRPDGTTVPSDELNKPEQIDQYLWMAPVSNIVTEQALDLGVFG